MEDKEKQMQDMMDKIIKENQSLLEELSKDQILYGRSGLHIDNETGKITKLHPLDPILDDQTTTH